MAATEDRVENRPTVLVAIEPRAYREAISQAIEMLRPRLSVRPVEQGMLAAEISRIGPTLVLCDGDMETPFDGVPNRVVFSRGQSAATAHLGGERVELDQLDLHGLLGVVDLAVPPDRDGGPATDDRKRWR